jgi:hypothetical protein
MEKEEIYNVTYEYEGRKFIKEVSFDSTDNLNGEDIIRTARAQIVKDSHISPTEITILRCTRCQNR